MRVFSHFGERKKGRKKILFCTSLLPVEKKKWRESVGGEGRGKPRVQTFFVLFSNVRVL